MKRVSVFSLKKDSIAIKHIIILDILKTNIMLKKQEEMGAASKTRCVLKF